MGLGGSGAVGSFVALTQLTPMDSGATPMLGLAISVMLMIAAFAVLSLPGQRRR